MKNTLLIAIAVIIIVPGILIAWRTNPLDARCDLPIDVIEKTVATKNSPYFLTKDGCLDQPMYRKIIISFFIIFAWPLGFLYPDK